MIVYWIIIVWSSFFGAITARYSYRTYNVKLNDVKPQNNTVFAIITFASVIFFSGLRNSVADTPAYIRFFQRIPASWEGLIDLWDSGVDKGFLVFTIVIKSVINDFHVWLFVIAAFTGVSIAMMLSKYSCNFFISVFMYVASCQFVWMFNGIRQYLAVVIIFLSFKFIVEERFFKYLLFVAIAATFHDTALIMIPIYFVVKGKALNWKTIAFLGLSFSVLFFSNQFIAFLDLLMTGTTYEGDLYYFKNDDGTNIIRVIVASVPALISLLYLKVIRKLGDNRLNILVNISVIASSIYIVSSATSGVLIGRLPIYLEIFNLILLPNLIERIFNTGSRKVIYSLMIFFYLSYFYFQLGITWGGLNYSSDILMIDL